MRSKSDPSAKVFSGIKDDRNTGSGAQRHEIRLGDFRRFAEPPESCAFRVCSRALKQILSETPPPSVYQSPALGKRLATPERDG